MTLTRAGWPRPIVDGWPIPWISPSDDLASMNGPRLVAAASGSVCAVCGGDYFDDEIAYALIKEIDVPESLEGVGVQAMDGAFMHERCLRLAAGRCPKLRSLREAGDLQLVRTKGNVADARIDDEGAIIGVLLAGTFEVLDLEAFLSKE